ncbi:MAG: hypothetical protein R2787_10010 [Saprospiraceae bacterium]
MQQLLDHFQALFRQVLLWNEVGEPLQLAQQGGYAHSEFLSQARDGENVIYTFTVNT